ncbi:MAG: glycosyltransferase family A protein [Xanthobacteraceae bacterium]
MANSLGAKALDAVQRAYSNTIRRIKKPEISVVVVVYNIERQARLTLLSLSADYQRHIDPGDYEVIVVDNGSNPPFDHRILDGLRGNFRLIRLDPAPASPARAVNRGIEEARGDIVGVMIDGARIVTPGLLHFARHGAQLYGKPVVVTLGWYLGYDLQRWSMQFGHDEAEEDALLASIGWPQDGYRLFEISTMDEPSDDGWLGPFTESNALFLRRETWAELGGMDERFDLPGGGLVNPDLLRRSLELPSVELVVLLAEGTFHQFHGGIATNRPAAEFGDALTKWLQQYQAIRGKTWGIPRQDIPRTYLGTLPRPVLARLVRSAITKPRYPVEPPLGRDFDQGLWSATQPARSAVPVVNRLIEIAHREFRAGRYVTALAVARLIRGKYPDEIEPKRLVSLLGGRVFEDDGLRLPEHQLALAEAHRLLGEKE